MSTIEKLIKRMLTIPKDFRIADCDRIMAHFGYRKVNARGGGSGLKYVRSDGSLVDFHGAHKEDGEKALKVYVIKLIIDELKKRGHIK